MDEHVVVRGTVVGEAGVAVAGWVSLGKKLPQRWLAQTVRIKTDDGRELTIEGLGADTIAPIVTREAKWQDLEGEELAKLCSREAPAPDVEVDFMTAVLRGGEPIVAWGPALDRGYVGGDSLRGSVEGGVTKLRAHVLASGDERESLVEKGRVRFEERERKEAEKAQAQQAKAKDKQPAKGAAPTAKAAEVDSVPWGIGMIVGVAGFVLCIAGAVISGERSLWLCAAAVCAWLPRAHAAEFVPRFRRGKIAGVALDIPFAAYGFGALGAGLFACMMTFGSADPAKSGGLRIAGLLSAILAGAATLGLTAATQKRRRYLAILANAPEHPDPIKDGVWGRSVGRFSDKVLDVGAVYTTTGSGKNATTRSAPFADIKLQAPLVRESSGLDVQLGDAEILTLAEYGIVNGIYQSRRGIYIDSTTPAIVAGRATDGVLRKGGEASLLVFATPPNTDVRRELARLRRRETIGGILAVVGAACLFAAFFV